jgi:methylated-DNA-[protein]-cysteine S-methyltransferase
VAVVATPCGPFTVVAVGDDVVASGWTDDVASLMALVHPAGRPGSWQVRRDLGAITRAVHDYLDGELAAIDAVTVRQQSGAFVEAAWSVLRALPAGSPVTYRELAARCGRPPGASRAAGLACQRNAAALFVPCHRVLRRDGSLGGYRWGLGVKRWLLDHESRLGPRSDGQLAGHGVVGAEPAVDDVLHGQHPRRRHQGDVRL